MATVHRLCGLGAAGDAVTGAAELETAAFDTRAGGVWAAPQQLRVCDFHNQSASLSGDHRSWWWLIYRMGRFWAVALAAVALLSVAAAEEDPTAALEGVVELSELPGPFRGYNVLECSAQPRECDGEGSGRQPAPVTQPANRSVFVRCALPAAADNWETVLDGSKAAFVEFYAPW